jgi:hypothetical protein
VALIAVEFNFDEFKFGGLHGKHEVEAWKEGIILAFA